MRRTHLAACAAIASSLAAPVAVAQDVNSSRLERAVTVEGINGHQQALQNIANMNGGTRYTRTAGFTASAAYVKATLENAGYDARYEMFNMPTWHEEAAPTLELTSPSSKTYRPGSAADDNSPTVDFIAFEHSPTKSVSGEVVTVGHTDVPSDGGSTSGCVASDFGADVDGAIALIQRGTCGFTQKLDLARRAGAAGVILFNEGTQAVATRCSAPPTRTIRSRPCSRAMRSARSSSTSPRAASTRR